MIETARKVAFFDTFAGCGGAAEGARQAGAVVPLSWEFWNEANDVHRANHPMTDTVEREIGKDPEEDVRILKVWFLLWREKGYHIHLHGSPPCQALSNASNRHADEGMVLVNYFLWLVEQTDPDSWSMENVQPVQKRLPEDVDSVILNAADYGAPQTRRRCFAGAGWTATPTHAKAHPTNDLPEWVTVTDALPHLLELIEKVNPNVRQRGIDEPFRTITSKIPSQTMIRLEALGSNAKRGNDSCLLHPSHTICGSGNQVGPRIFDHAPEKPEKIRSLSVDETKILQGFPSSYDFGPARTQASRWTMIGNAVVPAVMAAVIRGLHYSEEKTRTGRRICPDCGTDRNVMDCWCF